MVGIDLPVLLRIEAVCAATMLVLCLWPIARAFSALVRDLRNGGTGLLVSMLAVWFVAIFLRLVLTEPTFLSNLPDLHMFFERLFSPLGPASSWHHYHGMGGYMLHAGLAHLFGESYQTVIVVNGLLGSLAPLMLYLVTLRLMGDRRAAFIAAVLLAVFPPTIRVDVSEQIHSLSIFIVLITYFSVLEVLDKPTLRSYLAAGIAGAAAMQMRAEAMPHVFFACMLAMLRIRGMARPRWGFPLILGITVLTVAAVPRVVVTLLDYYKLGGLPNWGAGFGVFIDLFLSGRNIYVNPLFSLPVYPLLTLAGIAWLVMVKNWRLLAFFLMFLISHCFLYLCEWTLDINEALRFQTHIWFFDILLAGVGLAWLSRLVENRTVQGALISAGIVFAACSLIPARYLLMQPQPVDQDVLFFERHIDRLPAECRLIMLRASHAESETHYFGPRTWPMWLLKNNNRDDTLAYPGDLDSVDAIGGCWIAHVGIDCYRRYPSDDMSEEQIKEIFFKEGGPFLYEFIDEWHADLDRKAPTLLRSECRMLFDRYQLKPFETTTVSPGRKAWIWSPNKPVVVGFYFLK